MTFSRLRFVVVKPAIILVVSDRLVGKLGPEHSTR